MEIPLQGPAASAKRTLHLTELELDYLLCALLQRFESWYRKLIKWKVNRLVVCTRTDRGTGECNIKRLAGTSRPTSRAIAQLALSAG